MNPAVVPAYLEDASGMRGEAEQIYTPATNEEVQQIVRTAIEQRIPLTIAGAGTGVTGGRVPQGGWLLSLERFNQLEIHKGSASVGAGVLLKDLQAAATRSSQFYAPDPTEYASSIGGNIATNASGSRSFRYGSTRKHILALTAVMMDGSVRTFRRGEPIDFDVPELPLPASRKNTAGYPLRPGMDWVDLLAGSEGTLAIVTSAEVRLLPALKELLTGVVFFASDEEALAAVDEWRPIEGLSMLEYLDHISLDFLRPDWPDIPGSARAALIIEQEISDEGDLDAWIERAPETSWFAASARDRERIRRFRHHLPEIVNRLVRSRGMLKMSTDFAVPLAANRHMLEFYRDLLEREFPGQYVIFGHIGDAHLHINLLPLTQEDAARGRDLVIQFAREAVRLHGTVSAEHGLGKRKAHLLAIQYLPEHIDAMVSVKRRLDPHLLLGRGTLFPVELLQPV